MTIDELIVQLQNGPFDFNQVTAESDDHANIRNFMKTGWAGIQFEGEVLKEK